MGIGRRSEPCAAVTIGASPVGYGTLLRGADETYFPVLMQFKICYSLSEPACQSDEVGFCRGGGFVSRSIVLFCFVLVSSASSAFGGLLSTASVWADRSDTNCVGHSAVGTTFASAGMGACTDAPIGYPEPPETSGGVFVGTALGDNNISYVGHDELDTLFMRGTSQYSAKVQFANAGVKQIFATFAINPDIWYDPCWYCFGFVVNGWEGTLDPSMAVILTIDLGVVDTSQAFNLTAILNFSRGAGEVMSEGDLKAQLQGFWSGPVGGDPEQPITATLLPEPGTASLLALGMLLFLIGKCARRIG